METQNWALGAYAVAALALAGFIQLKTSIAGHLRWHHSPIGLCPRLGGDCGRWSGEADSSCRISGNASGHLDGLQWNWGEDELLGQGPTAVCIRTTRCSFEGRQEVASFFPGAQAYQAVEGSILHLRTDSN